MWFSIFCTLIENEYITVVKMINTHLFWSKRRRMTCSQITASVYKKSCTHFCKVFQCQFNTTFTLKIKNLSPIVYNKLSQHLKESTWTKMEMMSFTPEEFLGEQNWCPQKDILDFPSFCWMQKHAFSICPKLFSLAILTSEHSHQSFYAEQNILFLLFTNQ